MTFPGETDCIGFELGYREKVFFLMYLKPLTTDKNIVRDKAEIKNWFLLGFIAS